MPIPIEDSYVQIGADATRFWATARVAYVPAGDAAMAAWLGTGRTVVTVGSEADLNQTLAGLGLGELAPANVLDTVRGLDPILAKIAFNHENRIRALEAKAPITVAQFKAAIRALSGLVG